MKRGFSTLKRHLFDSGLSLELDFRDWYASIELSPSWFVKASAIREECLNYRGETGWGLVEWGGGAKI